MARRITKLEINNFKQYHKGELEFEQGKVGDLHLIVGDNTFGKTNLLNALLWALYGESALINSDDNGGGNDIKNIRHLKEETSVVLNLKDKENSEDIMIKRTDKRLTFIENGKPPTKDSDPESKIKTILPDSVSKLFLFKGEFLDHFFDNNKNDELKETILGVSKLKNLNRIKEILDELETNYRTKIQKENKTNKEVQEYSQDIDHTKAGIKKSENDLTKNRMSKRETLEYLEGIKQKLAGFDVNTINKLMLEEAEIRNLKEVLTSQINSIKNSINSLFVKNFAHYFLFLAIKKMNTKVRELQEKGIMPPPINSLLINLILEKKHCIVCDRRIDDKIVKHLKTLEKTVSCETGHHVNFNNLNSSNYFNEETFKTDVNRLNELINDKRHKDISLIALNKKLETVLDNLRKIKQEDIRNVIAQKEELDMQLESMSQKEVQILSDIKSSQSDLSILDINYRKLLSQTSGSKIERKKLEITQKLKEEVGEISKRVLKRISDELNNNTHKNFKTIFKNFYKNRDYKININEDFKIDVLDSEGNSLMGGRLAGGEIKVLALSFLIALSEFYGFDFPIIIDAPFTALGPDVASKVLESLKELSKKKQVILLTLPLEKEEDLKGIMKELREAATTVYIIGENVSGKGIYRSDTLTTKVRGGKK